MSNRPHAVPCWVAGAMLLAAVADWPYGYYQLLWLVACAAAVFAAYHAYAMKRHGFLWIFIFVAILFNPVLAVHLDKDLWRPIDLIAGIVFVIFAFVKSKAHGSNQNKPKPMPICYLCGNGIDRKVAEDQLEFSKDHVPPRQFFPKSLRQEITLNLDTVPSHKKCNNAYKDDEDYFYHSLYPLVANNNPNMAGVIFKDFVRRAHNVQTPALLHQIIANTSKKTKGGIILPPNMVEISVDLARIQRIAGKIARGVLFLESSTYLPEKNIVDMHICENESEVPKMYRIAWEITPIKSSYPGVFSYKLCRHDGCYIISLLFWEAFMFCVTIQEKITEIEGNR